MIFKYVYRDEQNIQRGKVVFQLGGLILLALFWSGFAVAQGQENNTDGANAAGAGSADKIEVIQSPNDKRSYQYLRLNNELQVLLISDPSADKAAAAMDVLVGSGEDPENRPGLAHFLEHMLFLGTEKYPAADEYQSYLNEHGGSHNAYTSLQHTNYFFDVDPAYLQPMLDRFAQFFIAPSLNAEYVDRERNAVHSEYMANIKNDSRRLQDVYREIINPDHPMAQFSVGNLTTLDNTDGESLRNDLLSFYDQYYNARNMNLVVLGKESLTQLKEWVEPLFAQVENATATAQQPVKKKGTQIPLFETGRLPLKVEIIPEQQQRYLKLFFPLPSMEKFYLEKPIHYLSNLLGDEGKGSLFALLKSQGWAEALLAGSYYSNRNETFFQINIRLTPEGLENNDTIVALCFAMIEKIKKQGVEEWRFNELKQLEEIAFRFQEPRDPIRTVSDLAGDLHYFSPQDVLRGNYLMSHFDSELLQRLVARLSPNNVFLVINAPGVETDKVSHYYNVPYKVHSLKNANAAATTEIADDFAKLASALNLPPVNEFIPKNLALKSEPPRITDGNNLKPVDHPELLKDASRIRVWFKNDETFNVPRANTFVRIKSPAAADSIEGSVMMDLYTALITDVLNEFAYPASLAGLDYSLRSNSRGFDLYVDGYNDGQDRLFQRIVSELRNPRFQRERFVLLKQELSLEWLNAAKQPPYAQIISQLPTMLFHPLWDEQAKIPILKQITFEKLTDFGKQLFVDARAEMLLYGNLTRQEATKLSARLELDLLGVMGDRKLSGAEVLKIENQEKPVLSVFPVDHNDRVVGLYLQGDGTEIIDQARILLLQQVTNSKFFHELRTERQLGYIVFARNFDIKSVPGLQFLVQSPTAGVNQLIEEIQAFNQRFVAALPIELDLHKQALITQLTEAPKNLSEQGQTYWSDIVDEYFEFNHRQQLAAAIENIGAQDYNEFLRRILEDSRRQLWLVSAAPDAEALGGQLDIVADWPSYWNERDKYEFP